MKRNLRLGIVLLAAVIHLVVPVAAYAVAMPVVPSGDFCSASRGAPAAPPGHRAPLPSTGHHCAHAPCCVGGAQDTAALPPPVPVGLGIAKASIRPLEATPIAAPFALIIAAQPRGPPALP